MDKDVLITKKSLYLEILSHHQCDFLTSQLSIIIMTSPINLDLNFQIMSKNNLTLNLSRKPMQII